MGMSQSEFWLCPIGLFLDLWECHKQFNGMSKGPEPMSYADELPEFD
jgi:hypothetical protein